MDTADHCITLQAREFAVKQGKCANHSHFTGVMAPGVAKGGSVFPRVRASEKAVDKSALVKKC